MRKEEFQLGGRTKITPGDFIVEEVWKDRICEVGYSVLDQVGDQIKSRIQREKEYLHFTLVKKNWDTIRALRYVGKRIHVSLRRFGIAGMKDKKAITAQRVSLWRGNAKAMTRLKLKDITLKNWQYANDRINLGSAIGNRFTITIRDISRTKRETMHILQRFKDLSISQGIPNYFGPQRLSGGNVEVGNAIKIGDLKLAVEVILQKIQPYLQKGGVNNIPNVFWYEKKMLRHLAKYPNDYAGALRRVPKRIRRLYVHAYQAYIFNQKLQQAILKGKISESIMVEGFRVPKLPELHTIAIHRQSFIKPKKFRIRGIEDGAATIEFTLARGEYASTLLSFLL